MVAPLQGKWVFFLLEFSFKDIILVSESLCVGLYSSVGSLQCGCYEAKPTICLQERIVKNLLSVVPAAVGSQLVKGC